MAEKGVYNVLRQDFMHSQNPNSSKGKLLGPNGDPLTQQRPNEGPPLSNKEITALYKSNRIFQNIVDIPAEDMTREWISIEADKKVKEAIENKLTELNAQPKMQDMCKYERLRGDGFCSIGARQAGELELEEELNPKQLIDIDYIHAFSGNKIHDTDINEDMFSPEYGDIEKFKISGVGGQGERKIHKSRLLHLQVRTVEDEAMGIPLIQSIFDPLTIFDNAAWSVGQLLYSLVFKVLKSDGVDITDTETRQKVQSQLEFEFNTLSLALIGKEDELDFKSPTGSLSSLKDMLEFVWDYLAGAARMPKSHIMGQQQGTITGGQFDSLNYYARIAGLQENYLRPLIEQLIDLLFWAKDSGVGNGRTDPDGKYSISFNPLWKLDKETDANIRKTVAETDAIYIKNQVYTADEIREERTSKSSLMEKLDMSEEETIEMARRVKEAHENATS